VREPVAKTQAIRVLDVVAIGPAMIWGGALLAPRRPALGWFLVASGLGTMIYNYQNHRLQRARSQGV
jgi:hypothetical protein